MHLAERSGLDGAPIWRCVSGEADDAFSLAWSPYVACHQDA